MGIMKNVSGAIFDLDGTLIDSNYVWEQACSDILSKRNINVSEDFLRIIAASNYEDAYKQMMLVGITDSYETILNELNEIALEEYKNSIVTKDEAEAFLKKLSLDGVKLSVATASPKMLYEPVLRRNNIYELFDNITSVDEVGKGKEHPDVYLKAAAKMGLNPADCIVFEDISQGILSAKEAGFKTVMVYDRYSQLDFFRMRGVSDHYIYSFADLL
jgi:HAD superfamily hydrolase (TIGR01509 family)